MSEELNCSEGARMLIERMQTHLDDFKVGGRFYWITEKMRGNVPRGLNELSDRDVVALTAAVDQYILEPWLTETVVDEIFNGDKRRAEAMQQDISNMYSKSLAASMAATKNAVSSSVIANRWSDPRVMSPGGVFNPAQGQVLWTEETGLQEKKQPSIFDEIRRKLKGEPK